MNNSTVKQQSALVVFFSVLAALSMTSMFITIDMYLLAIAILLAGVVATTFLWAELFGIQLISARSADVTRATPVPLDAVKLGVSEPVLQMLQQYFFLLEKSIEWLPESRALGIHFGATARAHEILSEAYGKRAGEVLASLAVISEPHSVNATPSYILAQNAINNVLREHAEGKTSAEETAAFVDSFSRKDAELGAATASELEALAYVLSETKSCDIGQLIEAVAEESKGSAFFRRVIGNTLIRLDAIAQSMDRRYARPNLVAVSA